MYCGTIQADKTIQAFASKRVLFICNGDGMLMRECQICGKMHRQGEPCPYAKRRNEEYDREHRNYARSAFYHSSSWKAIQKIVKAACHGLDIYEMNVNHRIVKGRIVHHIIPLSEAPEKALVLTNLVYVSDKTHRMIHDAYDKDAESKAKMQRKLFTLSEKNFRARG